MVKKKNFSASRQENSVEKQEGKQPKKNKQLVACEWVQETYGASLRFDDVAKKPQILELKDSNDMVGHWRYVENKELCDMVIECNQSTGVNISDKEIKTILGSSKYIKHVHPLREYVNNLEPWKGFDWIDQVAGQVTLKDPTRTDLWKRCFKKWFVAMVASWLDDEVVNHTVLVLIGKQGCGKTTWLEQLLPPEIRQYGCKMTSFQSMNKDQRLRLASCALLNIDELEAMGKHEMNVMKSVITTRMITERRAYRWDDESFARLASFCGSTNSRQFLNDPTGSRRWLPFEVEHIQDPHNRHAATEDIIYRGMYAQAKCLIENGFQCWFNEDEMAELEEHNDEYRLLSTEEELVPLLFAVSAEGKGEFMSNSEIQACLMDTFTIKSALDKGRISTILRKMGCESGNIRVGGQKTRGWYVSKRSVDEIRAFKKTHC